MNVERGLITKPGPTAISHRWDVNWDSLLRWLVMFAIISVAIAAVIEHSLSTIIFFYGFFAIGFLISSRLGGTQQRIFLTVYCGNTLIVLGLYALLINRYGIPYYGGGSDDLRFELLAQKAAENFAWWDYGNITAMKDVGMTRAYIFTLSQFVRISDLFDGFTTFIPRFFNTLLLALLSVIVYLAAREHFFIRFRTAVLTAILFGFAPIVSYTSALPFRDTLVALLSFLIIYLWAGFARSNPRQRLIIILVTPFLVVYLWEVRDRIAQIMILLILVALFTANTKSRFIRTMSLVLLVSIFVFVALELAYITNFLPSFSWQWIAAQYKRYTELRVGLSSGLAGAIFRAPLPISLALRLIYLAVSPIPIISLEIERLLQSAGTIIQVLLLPFTAIGFWFMLVRRQGLLYLGALVIIFSSVALVTFTGRHILMFYPFAALATGYGYDRVQEQGIHLGAVYLIVYFAALISVIVYIALSAH